MVFLHRNNIDQHKVTFFEIHHGWFALENRLPRQQDQYLNLNLFGQQICHNVVRFRINDTPLARYRHSVYITMCYWSTGLYMYWNTVPLHVSWIWLIHIYILCFVGLYWLYLTLKADNPLILSFIGSWYKMYLFF